MSPVRRPVLILVAALVAALCVSGGALAFGVGRNGKSVTAVRTVTAKDALNVTLSANTWIDVADMKTSVTVPATEKAVLVITYSMSSSCTPLDPDEDANCKIRVTLDGGQVDPGIVSWDWTPVDDFGQTSYLSARSFQWVSGPVAAGEHQVKVQMSAAAASIQGLNRTLTVLRSKF